MNKSDPQPESLVRSLEFQEVDSETMDTQPTTSHRKRRLTKVLLVIAGIVGVGVLISYFAVVAPVKRIMVSARKVEATAKGVTPFLKAQDLAGTKDHLGKVKADLDVLKSDLNRLSWTKVVPVARDYYLDGERGLIAADEMLKAGGVAIDAITPYADIIGLKGVGSTGDGAKTAQDRINFIINTLDKIKPSLSDIGSHLEAARVQMDQINPSRYPEEFRGIKLRSQLTQGIALIDQASTLVNDAKPLLESAPYMLGLDSPRRYLVIFQNDAELRPTGGFMTAYAVLSIDKGKISTIHSDDIYALDAKFTKRIPAPEPIKKYLPLVPYWNLRDQNLSPDLKTSMETFFPNYQLTKSPAVDGVFTVDTQVLVDLLKITGPIGVSGFGNFSAETDKRCNCPQVFYELELFADVEGAVVWDASGKIISAPKNYGARKSFIGPMMHSVLANTMAQPKEKMVELFNTGMRLIQAKHIQFYFPGNPTVQAAVESFNMAGRVREFEGDYLLVVDTNFAGAKTNAWVEYTSDQKVEIASDGTVTKTLTLVYKNPQRHFEDPTTKLKLNGIFRDWLRVYVPKGSELIEAKGFESGQAAGEDLGKTVFEGFFTLTPQNNRTVSLKYKLPFKVKSPYRLLIQKQAGSKDFPHTISVNGRNQPEIILVSDKEISVAY